ncbi:MAG: ribosome-binding factor A [Lentisphaerae bacterium RIFOXYB12_FULL_65_16]|nr:MAG: ribosome-binding factor A [Lentisphaerae bacterium RIFOXYA12_64_32]OGV91302.1 MAG: ribosome-binding factor A [Lentisphaerae bacterium RIFOXYB12_FULL_65_16]
MSLERMRRVNELIRRELGELCEREIAPNLQGLLTITQIQTAPDLRQAVVYVSVMGDEAQHRHALRLLLKRRAWLQHELNQRVQLKYTPVLTFKLDRAGAQADRVLSILEEIDPHEPVPAAEADAEETIEPDEPTETK